MNHLQNPVTVRLIRFGIFAILTAVTATCAPGAAADEGDYLHHLAPLYKFLSEEQLLSEGRRICDANHSGQNSYDSIVMVMNDLKVSGGVAQNIVITANIHLGC